MRISEAFYTLASIRRANTSHRPRSGQSPQTADPGQTTPGGGFFDVPGKSTTSPGPVAQRSLAEMLHQHFVEEVRLRDRDKDGLLSQDEYASTPEEFRALDSDSDGRVGAFDLVQAAMQRNRDLSEIVAGPWAPIYSAILNSPLKDNASLDAAAQMGAQEVVNQEQELASSSWIKTAKDDTPPSSTVEGIMGDFRSRHDRLDLLRTRLDDLATRLGSTPQYQHVDHMA